MAAAFFNFDPAMVRRAVPSCWDAVDPAELTVWRAEAAAGALGELLRSGRARGAAGGPARAARASAHCAGEGRPMTGANRALWPSVEAALRRRGLPEAVIEVGRSLAGLHHPA